MKYKFEQHNIEFENPEIEIKSDGITIHPSKMEIEVDLILSVKGATYGVRLTEVKVENLNYDSKTLGQRVMARLKDFEV